MWELLQAIKTALETVSELETVKIGSEIGISSGSTPAARIITEYREPSPKNKYFDQGAIQILLLLDLKNDLPSVYEDSILIEDKIRVALANTVLFNRTEYDRDSVTSYKASIIRFTFSGIRNDKKECVGEV